MFDMAEGVEETENNNNNSGEKIVMLGAVMPCEMSGPNLGGLKRELEIIPATGATAITSPGATTPTIQQQHPINLKSEMELFVKDIERDNESPSNSPARPISRCSTSDIYSNIRERCEIRMNSQTPSPPPPSLLQQNHQHHHHSTDSKNTTTAASVAAAQAHFNGTMQGILNLQKLQQNIASMTQPVQQQLQSSQIPNMPPGISALNSPLNLSVGGGPSLGCQSGLLGGLNLNTSQMPQLILASGQLVQGIQGAQLLIPTSQGIATQTILTIPVSQQVNTNEQLVQSLAAMNGIGGSPGGQNNNIKTSLGNQGGSGILSPHLLASSVQQLLSAINPMQPQQQSLNPSQKMPTIPGSPPNVLLGSHLSRAHTPKSSPPRIASASSISSVGSSHHHELINPPIIQSTCMSTTSSSSSSSLSSTMSQRHHPYDKNNATTTTSTTTLHSQSQTPNYSLNGHSQLASSPNHLQHRLHHSSDPHHLQHHHSQHHHNMSSHQSAPTIQSSQQILSNRGHSPNSLAISNINRLTSTNGELTITKSHGPSPSLGSSSSSSSHPSGNVQLVPQIKLSPSSMQMSPTGSDCSRNDLLDDNPNEPTINQTNVNVVDGIDLDEIKEFAKAFKLRRLSLGLTQTQVGQALSVTEGPAYSQSAICSALAAQMYAAQLSSQQQAMFEKLDITPKSAQKIKPVLERWMKEAEERYKSGQNHLTEFIGVEPSKKRKRRTSFTPQALELLNAHFERNTHPSGTEITGLAHQLGYEREVIRIWFCNKRQALKNTVRMMSKSMV